MTIAVVVLAIVSLLLLTLTAHSFTTRPISVLISSPLSSSVATRRNVKLSQQQSQSTTIAIAIDDDEVKIVDGSGRPLINNSHNKSLIQRLFFFNRNKSSTTITTSTIRGSNKYGLQNNSTISTPIDAAIKVNVEPTRTNATKQEWQRAWKIHRYLMKVILHKFDDCKPTDSKLALACLWWKALAGNSIHSPVYDYQLSYDLLPSVTRWIVNKRICNLYPRLHHANVEIRTAYLDKSLSHVINTIMMSGVNDANNNTTSMTQSSTTTTLQQKKKKKIRLIVMGGGYDTRSIKLLERSLLLNEAIPHYDLLKQKYKSKHKQQQQRWWRRLIRRRRRSREDHSSTSTPINNNAFDNITTTTFTNNYKLECYELDLPEVVAAKRKLLQTRLVKRRPWLRDSICTGEYPRLISVDFNNLQETKNVLERILLPSSSTNNSTDYSNDGEEEDEKRTYDNNDDDNVYNIILFEGVMIYLNEGIPHSLLGLCCDALTQSSSSSAALCFADRLDNIPGGDESAANIEMESTGWELVDWLSKPGLARHMGIARLR